MFPCTEISSKTSFPAVLPWQKKATILKFVKLQNRNEGTFAETALVQNHLLLSIGTHQGGQRDNTLIREHSYYYHAHRNKYSNSGDFLTDMYSY